MNVWQVVRQIQWLLQAQAWTGGAAEKVFPEVHVVDVEPGQLMTRLQLPAAFVGIGPAKHDPYEVGLVTQELTVTVLTHVAGTYIQSRHIIGGNRTGGVGSSLGRGLLEIEEELYSAIDKLSKQNGLRLLHRAQSSANLSTPDGAIWWGGRVYTFEVNLGHTREYTPARYLEGTSVSGSQASLTWKRAPDRFDRLSQVLRRASGATAPTSVTAGTGVTVSSTAEAVTDSPGGAGTYSYALFTQYDETGGGVATNTSSSTTVTVVVS